MTMIKCRKEEILFAALLALAASSALVSSLPNNIRILVNNENLQSPPYLLEAFKQQGANNGTARQVPSISNSTNILVTAKPEPASTTIAVRRPATQIPPRSEPSHNVSGSGSLTRDNEDESPGDGSEELENSTNSGYSLLKEETIEEVIDADEFDSKLPLSKENSDQEASPSSLSSMMVVNLEAGGEQHVSLAETVGHLQPFPGSSLANSKKHQQMALPVANSHLKKPAFIVGDESDSGSSNNRSIQAVEAKSVVSATAVDADAAPAPTSPLDKRKAPGYQPDVIQPDQVMQGVANASLIPATVTKEYGSHSRTRVTLGGGYVRDRLPPLENPASSNYHNDKPEKPVAPLETASVSRKQQHQDNQMDRGDMPPERIILPDVREFSASFNNKSFVKDLARCPRSGVITLEHPHACDRYFYCKDGFISEQICPNGLMYGTKDTIRDYCIHRWLAQCDDKSIPNPISSPGCRWQFGIFNVQGSPKCTPDYYECFDGVFQVKKCSLEGQVYDDRTKSCQFAELIGCAKEALADFQCPPDDQGNTYWPFPRYFLNERALIHCVADKPQIIRCTNDERVDPEHLHCVPLSKLAASSGGSGAGSLDARRVLEKKSKPQTPA